MSEKQEIKFSEWLKKQLNTRTITGSELSQIARISKAAVYFYLDGSRIPDRSVIEKIATALEIDITTVPEFARKPTGYPAQKRARRRLSSSQP
jgi:transcriptional regulator with XRE-family HTH domain